MIMFDFGFGEWLVQFCDLQELIVVWQVVDLFVVFVCVDVLCGEGVWIVGWLIYEVGFVFELCLWLLIFDIGQLLVVLGVYVGFLELVLLMMGKVWLFVLILVIMQDDYCVVFVCVQVYIVVGDCYQINLIFLLDVCLIQGMFVDLVFVLVCLQLVGFGVFVDMGVGLVVILCLFELFFCMQVDGWIEVCLMKGIVLCYFDFCWDVELVVGLVVLEKNCVENLMIVDLLCNDILMLVCVGFVCVFQFFVVESFVIVYQMILSIMV